MKIAHVDQVGYLKANITILIQEREWDLSFDYTMTITIKSVKTNYQKILNVFIAIDLSNNKFKGEIPHSIGSLKGLQSLNLSNNDFIGPIPPSLGKLSRLESLELSRNNLSRPWWLHDTFVLGGHSLCGYMIYLALELTIRWTIVGGPRYGSGNTQAMGAINYAH
ncbi:hypothetical protein LguiA_026171 [Lonicera macranthoides]